MKLKQIMKPRTPIVESGTYLAVCVGVLFIGEQYKEYKDHSSYEHQITFIWELPSELDGDGNPKQLSKDINATSSPNGNLNNIMTSWNSRKYTREELEETDICDQLGKPCQLTVSVSESGYSNVNVVTDIPKGIPAPTTSTPYITFDVDEWDDRVFDTLPEWAKEKIKKSTQYQKLHTPTDKVDFPESHSGAAVPAQAEECPI